MAITHSSITVLVCYSLFIFDIWNAWVVILWIAYPLNKGKTMQHFSNDLNIKNCQHGTGLLPLIYKSLLTDVSTREDYLPLFMKTYWQRPFLFEFQIHLSPEDFERHFQMKYTNYVTKPAWKQQELKKKAGLF